MLSPGTGTRRRTERVNGASRFSAKIKQDEILANSSGTLPVAAPPKAMADAFWSCFLEYNRNIHQKKSTTLSGVAVSWVAWNQHEPLEMLATSGLSVCKKRKPRIHLFTS